MPCMNSILFNIHKKAHFDNNINNNNNNNDNDNDNNKNKKKNITWNSKRW